MPAFHPLRALEPLERLPAIDGKGILEIADDDVHLWYCFCDRARDPRLLEAYVAMLSPDERARHEHFLFEKDRHEYLVTRALVRTVLSRYASVAPAEWQFVRSEHDKPFVSGPAGVPWPSFNLSNTRGLVVCAVGHREDVLGVDVEDTERRGETLSIAESYFSPFEVRALRSLPAPLQRDHFFRYWTLKESYIKARGLGLAIPLDQFSFHLDDGPDIRVSFDARLKDDPEAWSLSLLRASPRHVLALARRGKKERTRLLAACIVPPARGAAGDRPAP